MSVLYINIYINSVTHKSVLFSSMFTNSLDQSVCREKYYFYLTYFDMFTSYVHIMISTK